MNGHQDVLTAVLGAVRFSGTIYFRAAATSPWAVHVPGSKPLLAMLSPEAGGHHVAAFHVVTRGRCVIRLLPGGPDIEASSGDLVVIPRGDAHVVADHADTPPVELGDIVSRDHEADGAAGVVILGGGGAPCELVCGGFVMRDAPFNPLLGALPAVLHLPATDMLMGHWLDTTLRFLSREAGSRTPGGGLVANRLAEILFVQVIRHHVESISPGDGWLGALRDPVVARALTLLHARPEAPWTVPELARQAGASRSGLAAKFTTALDVSPLRYLTRWRMTLAAELLRTTDLPISQIAGRVGYATDAAFSKVFKRHFSVPPASWRSSA